MPFLPEQVLFVEISPSFCKYLEDHFCYSLEGRLRASFFLFRRNYAAEKVISRSFLPTAAEWHMPSQSQKETCLSFVAVS